jgi:hypothetical protein
MRKIEYRICNLLNRAKNNFTVNNKILSCRDSIHKYTEYVGYALHKSELVKINKYGLMACIPQQWQTRTTKNRLNAILHYFNLPGIYQRNFLWFWSDTAQLVGLSRYFEFLKRDNIITEKGQIILDL